MKTITYDLYKRIMDCVDKDTRTQDDGPNLHPTYLEARALLEPMLVPNTKTRAAMQEARTKPTQSVN